MRKDYDYYEKFYKFSRKGAHVIGRKKLAQVFPKENGGGLTPHNSPCLTPIDPRDDD